MNAIELFSKDAPSVSNILRSLKENAEDFEWFPSTQEQIDTIGHDINRILEVYEVSKRHSQHDQNKHTVLDIGAGCGRVVLSLCDLLSDDYVKYKPLAIEKATTHIGSYSKKGIQLIGTEFFESNLISKHATFAFCNPPYSEFSSWISRIIQTLNFSVFYAIIPNRWQLDKDIESVCRVRGLKYTEVIAESDFFDADRKARAKVHLVRFSFIDLSVEAVMKKAKNEADDPRFHYQPSLTKNATCPFQQFIENEIGLKKTHSITTEKFCEISEKRRVREAMRDETTQCYALVKSVGVVNALIENYEHDIQRVLNQYKLISQLDSNILAELGIKYSEIAQNIEDKLFGYRHVYWALLFEHLDAISEKLISKHKTHLLNTLKSNALDINFTNMVYICNYAVELANGLIEQSLIDVFENLTSSESIKRYYVSNEHVYKDDWRYNQDSREASRACKRELDYRFIYSSHSNFSSYSWEQGLTESARQFVGDLMVVPNLLGYSYVTKSMEYDDVRGGDIIIISGQEPGSNKRIDLLTIRMYLNGNRHIKFNKELLLRFNICVSKLLNWVRSKEQYEAETEQSKKVSDKVWACSDNIRINKKALQLLLPASVT